MPGEARSEMDQEMADAVANEFANDSQQSAESEQPQETLSAPEATENEASHEESQAELKDVELPTEPRADDVSDDDSIAVEDRLKGYREALSKAGLGNRAEQGERWYKELQEYKQKAQELEQYRAEREKQEAEIAESRTRADQIIGDAPADLKSEWGRMRQEYGDRWLISAYKRYLDDLRRESPEDYERETARAEQRRLQQELEKEREERIRFQQQFERKQYSDKRDTTLKSLSVDPKDFERLAEAVDGAYVTTYMRLQEQGKDPSRLDVGEIASRVVKYENDLRKRIADEERKKLLEEAKTSKGPRKRKEEPVAPKGQRAKDIDDAMREEMKRSIVEEFEGTG